MAADLRRLAPAFLSAIVPGLGQAMNGRTRLAKRDKIRELAAQLFTAPGVLPAPLATPVPSAAASPAPSASAGP